MDSMNNIKTVYASNSIFYFPAIKFKVNYLDIILQTWFDEPIQRQALAGSHLVRESNLVPELNFVAIEVKISVYNSA